MKDVVNEESSIAEQIQDAAVALRGSVALSQRCMSDTSFQQQDYEQFSVVHAPRFD